VLSAVGDAQEGPVTLSTEIYQIVAQVRYKSTRSHNSKIFKKNSENIKYLNHRMHTRAGPPTGPEPPVRRPEPVAARRASRVFLSVIYVRALEFLFRVLVWAIASMFARVFSCFVYLFVRLISRLSYLLDDKLEFSSACRI
jgi:hypothetical protein